MNTEKRIIGYIIYGFGCGFEPNSAAVVKAFVWNNEESMMPASNVVSLELLNLRTKMIRRYLGVI